jgi:(1->4)-alpha-D-glucan 1-alpha-D-glucosylmutase
VADFYQGTELWDLSFVDPDNRRPVDFALRRALLAELKQREREDRGALLERLLDAPQDGASKLYVTYKGLQARRAAPELFRDGAYLALLASGERAEHVCAFARRLGGAWAVAAAGRLLAKSGAVNQSGFRQFWQSDELLLPADAPECWSNSFTGETLHARKTALGNVLSLAELFGRFPVALLRAEVEPQASFAVAHALEETVVGLPHGG